MGIEGISKKFWAVLFSLIKNREENPGFFINKFKIRYVANGGGKDETGNESTKII